RELWESRQVDVYDAETKVVRHPELGLLRWDCDILTVQRSDLRVVVYTAQSAAPGR
ncbi:MAG: DNA-binding protein, partial [Streptomyces oryziradicis]|nr:DNA-binding protein [Actinacidiphila oryziradicis]